MEVYSNLKPTKNISVHEGMIALWGRLSFRQNMPAKPTKYRIKVCMAADSSNGYVLNFDVYSGKEGTQRRIYGLGYDVVMKFSSPIQCLKFDLAQTRFKYHKLPVHTFVFIQSTRINRPSPDL